MRCVDEFIAVPLSIFMAALPLTYHSKKRLWLAAGFSAATLCVTVVPVLCSLWFDYPKVDNSDGFPLLYKLINYIKSLYSGFQPQCSQFTVYMQHKFAEITVLTGIQLGLAMHIQIQIERYHLAQLTIIVLFAVCIWGVGYPDEWIGQSNLTLTSKGSVLGTVQYGWWDIIDFCIVHEMWKPITRMSHTMAMKERIQLEFQLLSSNFSSSFIAFIVFSIYAACSVSVIRFTMWCRPKTFENVDESFCIAVKRVAYFVGICMIYYMVAKLITVIPFPAWISCYFTHSNAALFLILVFQANHLVWKYIIQLWQQWNLHAAGFGYVMVGAPVLMACVLWLSMPVNPVMYSVSILVSYYWQTKFLPA